MRAGPVAAVAMAVLTAAALGLSCKTYKDEGEKVPPGYEAGIYPPAPERMVHDDGGLIMGGGGQQGGGGMVIAGSDAGGTTQRDAAAASPDQGVTIDSGRADGDGTCDLLTQGCGPEMGCYPGAAGQGRCERFEPGSPEGGPCGEPSNCAPGLTCITSLCTPLCALAQPSCPNGRRCVAYPGYEGVGYCLP